MARNNIKRERNKFILNAIIVIVIIFIALSLLIRLAENSGIKLSERVKTETGEKQSNANEIKSDEQITPGNIEMKLPAVDAEGKGVTTALRVEAREGNGKTLVDIDNVLFWADTQQSIRIASLVAQNITNKKIDNFDLTYSVEANASVIGGPSAGAALAIATIAALENKKPREDVMITGTINHDGSIGPVSGILEKAEAAKKANATIFLVPLLQSRDIVYETSKHCEKFGLTEICTTETKPKRIDVSNETGITIQEVETIQDAMKYFFD